MSRFAVALLVLGLSACATTRQDASHGNVPSEPLTAQSALIETGSEALEVTAASAKADPYSADAIRARGLLKLGEIGKGNAKASAAAPVVFRRTATPLSARRTNELRLHSLPVGAGSCHLLECPGPDAELMLFDCGSTASSKPRFDTDAIRGYIERIAGGRMIKVVVSHPHADHYNQVADVVPADRVAQLWLGGNLERFPSPFRRWITAVQIAQAARGAGEVAADPDLPPGWHNDDFAVEQLGCGNALSYVATVNVGNNPNSQSLVLSVEHDRFKVLLTGDATGPTHDSAMANFPDPQLDATVATAAHHGADTENSNHAEWIAAIRPEIIVYSTGEKHLHPRCSVVEDHRVAGTLLPAEPHTLRCGVDGDYVARQTRLHEYNTFDSGVIVITSDGELQALRVECLPDGC